MIAWEPSKKTPGTTYGRVGKILFFKISIDYNYRILLVTRTFSAIAADTKDQQMWVRAGYFDTEEDAIKAANEQWPIYLKQLGLTDA